MRTRKSWIVQHFRWFLLHTGYPMGLSAVEKMTQQSPVSE